MDSVTTDSFICAVLTVAARIASPYPPFSNRGARLSKLEMLLKRIQKPEEKPKPKKLSKPPKPSKKLLMLLNRVNTREWLLIVEGQLMEAIVLLRHELKFIEHLPHCRICQCELQLDVERYNGTRLFWYLSLENSEYLQEAYPDCPKEEDYNIDNYWWQVERYRKIGTTESDEVNTLAFIMDRAKWAYKIAGKQIRLSRQLLRLVRTWDFSERCFTEYSRVYEKLGMYEIANPSFFYGV